MRDRITRSRLAAICRSLFTAVVLASAIACAQDFDTRTHTVAPAENAARTRANAAMEAHDYAGALNVLLPLAAANPKDARLQYDVGSAQDALDQTSGAESSYRVAIAVDAAYLDPHLALGLLYARNGRMAEARTELIAATERPGDGLLKARAWRSLARIDQRERPVDARDELLAALKISPETPEDTLLSAELAASATNGAAVAEAAYRRLLVVRPDDPDASAALARLLVGGKRQAEAEGVLSSALAAHPGDPVLTTQMASLLASEGKAAEALPMVASLHVAHPDDAGITRLLAGMQAQSGNYAAAEPLYASLSAASPADVTLMEAHADALIWLKRFPEAQAILTRAVGKPTLFPAAADLGDAAGKLAFAASANHDSAAVLQALAVRATVLPPSPATLFLEAIAEDTLHHVRLARQAYQEFLAASNGSNPDQEFEATHRLLALEHMK